MERIQHAIEKARAARTDAVAGPGVAQAPAGCARQPAESGAEAAVLANWQALREVAVPAQALVRAHVVTATGEKEAVRFDMMRTKLIHEVRANQWRRIAITSPGPSCGKTTVCLNLAYSLARQPEVRVVVVEADLRRPSLAKVLGLRPSVGVAEFLDGQAGLSDVSIRLRPNLAVLSSPEPRRNAPELFQSPATAQAIAALEEALEPTVVLFDLPPVLSGDDVMSFAGHVDAALIIAGAGTTTIAEIDNCERELASRTNIMGVVVNSCRYLGKDYDYKD
ncbi:CpsD/CapB family tyrosine-protein kinase [Rubellimicrobium aerolatum]|uniref:CpsD/CapB family tyrosine-protein kinase n=1 Tax=Rubellimicrobium aerolatum TaxID=490979 RepID=A0ABW0S9K2_9RHOB|nr:CpsD/CapB family tyrosine-protein kinase [Rubellimicrobium aerolatum]MBP1804930.1 Mrp family chromosome partitioning ATPase [Rubellimicrobium aerolatum]